MKKSKILIVEDQSVVSTNIKMLLKFTGYNVIGIASTATECFDIIEKEIPDLVLMDISLPGIIDGIEAAQEIKEKWDIPIIYLTARTDDDTLQRAKVTEPYGYITKDVELKSQLPIIIEFSIYRHKMSIAAAKAQAELKESEEKFRSIFASARDAIVFLDNDGKVSLWNDSAKEIFGYDESEVLGQQLYTLIAPIDYEKYYRIGFTDFAEDGKGTFIGSSVELEARKKSDEIFPIEITLSSFLLDNEWCACGIIRDVSVRKSVEEEMAKLIEELSLSRDIVEENANELIRLNDKLSESEEELKNINASKDKFFSIISHDLKGPFQGLIGYSEILSKEAQDLPINEIKEFSTDIYNTAVSMYKLLENLLHWSRMQRGVITYNPTSFQIKMLVEMNINLLKANSTSKKIQLINEVPDELIVFADENMVDTILRNLISNAIKFTRISGSIVISAKKYEDNKVLVSVQDDGIGIEQEDIGKLFQIDIYHTTSGTANEKGTGLGLVLCKDLVKKNEGKIWVESQVNVGTTFYFTLSQT